MKCNRSKVAEIVLGTAVNRQLLSDAKYCAALHLFYNFSY